jgi:hypothetical protein
LSESSRVMLIFITA